MQQESINQFPEESESFRFSTSNLLGATALVGILHDSQLPERYFKTNKNMFYSLLILALPFAYKYKTHMSKEFVTWLRNSSLEILNIDVKNFKNYIYCLPNYNGFEEELDAFLSLE